MGDWAGSQSDAFQVDPEIAKINDEYNSLVKELRKKLGLPALAAAPIAKEDEKK